MDAKLENFFVI